MDSPPSSSPKPFRLFSTKSKPKPKTLPITTTTTISDEPHLTVDRGSGDADPSSSFSDLGLSSWAVGTCKELGILTPTPVQRSCIPKILSGLDVLGIAQTGTGKTAAFALPILHRLAEDPFGVFALVITPTRELACQIVQQFRALGSSLGIRCALVVGGMSIHKQSVEISERPHVVVATPGRIKALLEDNPDVPPVFSKTKFLVLDEADRVLDVGFEDELKVIFRCLPKTRQTLLFSATMTSELQALLEVSSNKSYFYEAYEGFKTVESLEQQYIFTPQKVKEIYLFHVLSKMNDEDDERKIRSVIVFVSTCRSCHLLSLLLEELGLHPVALHSFNSQSQRLSALGKFKSGRAPILLATDVASRGLDIPTVDLVINYDIPSYPRDYVHRVGRTARAGRGGFALSFITENDIDLIHDIEAVIGKKLEAYDCAQEDEEIVREHITKVYKARRLATMKMIDDGFEDKIQARKEQKRKRLTEKGLLMKQKR